MGEGFKGSTWEPLLRGAVHHRASRGGPPPRPGEDLGSAETLRQETLGERGVEGGAAGHYGFVQDHAVRVEGAALAPVAAAWREAPRKTIAPPPYSEA